MGFQEARGFYRRTDGFQEGERVPERTAGFRGGKGVSEKVRGHSRIRKGFQRKIWGFKEAREFYRRVFKKERGSQKGLVVSEEAREFQKMTKAI
jgi:hypothetical protein